MWHRVEVVFEGLDWINLALEAGSFERSGPRKGWQYVYWLPKKMVLLHAVIYCVIL
jgi:hypothetical protein